MVVEDASQAQGSVQHTTQPPVHTLTKERENLLGRVFREVLALRPVHANGTRFGEEELCCVLEGLLNQKGMRACRRTPQGVLPSIGAAALADPRGPSCLGPVLD